jgi:vacuolar protein sorting-associated protein 13A/C
MIERLVSSILASKLGEFVEGISQDTVKISILSGEFAMKNPALRADALDSLELPITVEAGFLGLLKFKLPWKSLTSQPAVIQIQDLYALVGPRKQQVRLPPSCMALL